MVMAWQEGKPAALVTRARYWRWYLLHVSTVTYALAGIVLIVNGLITSDASWPALPEMLLIYLIFFSYLWLPFLVLASWAASNVLAADWRRPSFTQRIKGSLLFAVWTLAGVIAIEVVSAMSQDYGADYPPDLLWAVENQLSEMFVRQMGLTLAVSASCLISAHIASYTVIWNLKGPKLWISGSPLSKGN